MVDVKVPALPVLPAETDMHIAVLAGRLLEMVRASLTAGDWGGLRTSHFRLLSVVPSTGATVTELSRLLLMTKQGVGQFVSYLQSTGHLEVRTDARDRRRRIVVRTALGDDTVTRVGAVIATLEHEWSERVGVDRYQGFRGVLQEIVGDIR